MWQIPCFDRFLKVNSTPVKTLHIAAVSKHSKHIMRKSWYNHLHEERCEMWSDLTEWQANMFMLSNLQMKWMKLNTTLKAFQNISVVTQEDKQKMYLPSNINMKEEYNLYAKNASESNIIPAPYKIQMKCSHKQYKNYNRNQQTQLINQNQRTKKNQKIILSTEF